MKVPAWWPPRVGDKLRRFAHDSDALLHVIAVFEDEGETFVVTKEWWQSKQRWHREVQSDIAAMVGSVYPDGQERPKV